MSDLRTLLGYQQPIFNAPMAGAAGGRLAAAVSQAGGVGMIGAPATPVEEWIEQQLEHVKDLGTPWGVGFMGWAVEDRLSVVEAFLSHDPAVVAVSFGDPTRAAGLAHEAGVLTAMQVGNTQDLRRALEDDIDLVICRGSEGGGHGRNEVGTLPLLQLAATSTHKPVIAAGGIGTAHGVAAALAGGAQAVWVGTRFVTAEEAAGHQNVKNALTAAGLDDTVYTRAFDIAQQLPWAPEFGGRALANEFSERWAEKIAQLEGTADDAMRQQMETARRDADARMAPFYAGQAVEFTYRVQSAAQIMAELAGFRAILSAAARRFS